MPSYMWKSHDRTLASCWEFARDIQSRIEELDARAFIIMLDYRHRQSRPQDILTELNDLRRRALGLVQRTWELYEWARDEGKALRPAHPWDTEPASQSEYARALGIKDGRPVSPMRVVVQLHKLLTDTFEEVMRL
jgi:hypothetical protein